MANYEKAHPPQHEGRYGSLCRDKACAEEPDPSVFFAFKTSFIIELDAHIKKGGKHYG